MVNLPPPGTDEFSQAVREIKSLVEKARAMGLDQFVWRGQTILTDYAENLVSMFSDD